MCWFQDDMESHGHFREELLGATYCGHINKGKAPKLHMLPSSHAFSKVYIPFVSYMTLPHPDLNDPFLKERD